MVLGPAGAIRGRHRHAEEAIRIAEGANHPYSLAFAIQGLGSVHLQRGDLPRALPLLERSLALCRGGHYTFILPGAAAGLGYAQVLAGRFSDGLPLLQDAVAQSASIRFMPVHTSQVVMLSAAYGLAGRLEDARQAAERGLSLARTQGQRGVEAQARLALGELEALGAPRTAEHAEEHFRKAMALAAELGMRPLVSRCHLGVARLYRRTGKPLQAQEHLTTAMTMLRDMGMRVWLDQAEAEMGRAAP